MKYVLWVFIYLIYFTPSPITKIHADIPHSLNNVNGSLDYPKSTIYNSTLSEDAQKNLIQFIENFVNEFSKEYAVEDVIPRHLYFEICKYLFVQKFSMGSKEYLKSAITVADSYGFRRYANETFAANSTYTFSEIPAIIDFIWHQLFKYTEENILNEVSDFNRIMIKESVKPYSEDDLIELLEGKAQKYGLQNDLSKEFLQILSQAILIRLGDGKNIDNILDRVVVSMRNMVHPECANCKGELVIED